LKDEKEMKILKNEKNLNRDKPVRAAYAGEAL
jgi:hypothetical protein